MVDLKQIFSSFTDKIRICLKIHKAVAFIEIIKSGGSTYPWVVLVADENNLLRKFVVKSFTPGQMAGTHPIAKDVFGNLLAREFDLPAPEIDLIEFGKSFIESLPTEIKENFLREKDQGFEIRVRINGGYANRGCGAVEATP